MSTVRVESRVKETTHDNSNTDHIIHIHKHIHHWHAAEPCKKDNRPILKRFSVKLKPLPEVSAEPGSRHKDEPIVEHPVQEHPLKDTHLSPTVRDLGTEASIERVRSLARSARSKMVGETDDDPLASFANDFE